MRLEDISLKSIQKLIPELLEIREESYEDRLREHAAVYTLFSVLYAQSLKMQTEAENDLDSLMATKTKEAKDSSPKKLTVADTTAIIDSDTEIIGSKQKFNEMSYKVNLLKGLLKGLDHQKDCLVQISANKRKEKDLYLNN